MSRLAAIAARLPSLYRPEIGAGGSDSLFEALLASIAASLDDVHRSAGEVLQSRWIDVADKAAYSRFFALSRKLEPTLDPREFPYIRDLARVAAMLPLSPWQQPEALRESVEAFRLRVERSVRLYRDGLATIDALRAIVEASLPISATAEEAQRDRPFLIEELVPAHAQQAIPTPGAPAFELGPLMRFSVENAGLVPVQPTFYVQALPGAAHNPMLELYRSAQGFARIGLALRGTLAAGQTLRLRPAYSAWLATAIGLLRASSLPDEETQADPAVDGPWTPVAAAPPGAASALLQTQDRALLLATGATPTASLWRFDGQSWTELLSGLPTIHALLEREQHLLIATESGLLQLPLYPALAVASPIVAFAGQAVHALLLARDRRVWVGSALGLFRLEADDSAAPFGLGATPALQTPVFGVSEDARGTLHVAAERGLFVYRAATRRWAVYAGAETTEQREDFQAFDPDAAGAALPEGLFLPPVRCVQRSADAALWIGTQHGLARYVARPALTPSGEQTGTGLSFVTVLEAFPDVDTGSVSRMRTDEHGQLWIAAERGVFRYDGRDLWQLQATGWVQLGRADHLYPRGRPAVGRGAFRFVRETERWQRFDEDAGRWNDFPIDSRASNEASVNDVLWCAEVSADTGSFDGTTFSSAAPVLPTDLVMRFKPDEQRIVNGGIAALPTLPLGEAVFRYLSMEDPDYAPPEQRPAWSPEGRLLPPLAAPLSEAPPPARFDIQAPPPSSDFDASVYAFAPAARVWVAFGARRARSVLVRLVVPTGTTCEPAIIDRVWQGMQLVRPAGVRTALAINRKLMRVQDGNA